MKFAIVGGGGVGGYLAARLTQAGHDVGVLARGPNLAVLRDRGIRLESPLGDVETGPIKASDDPRALGTADAVFMTTKLYDLENVARLAAPLAAEGAIVVPVQNGVEAHEILARALPGAAVLKATIYISSFLVAPGAFLHKSPFCRLSMAAVREADRTAAGRLVEVLAAAPGIEAAISGDIDADLWKKFTLLAPFAAVACVARAPVRPVLEDPALLAQLKSAMAEVVAVARARGVKLPDGIEAACIGQIRQFPPHAKPSMLEDLEAGRPLELEYLSGAVLRFGAAAGVSTPIHEAAYRALLPHAAGARERRGA